MEWYKHHVSDYLSATRDLTLAQHGAYCLLLNLYYQQEGPLKVDERYIFRLCNALHWREKEAVRYVLGKFFIPLQGMYHNTRADEEILKYQRQRDANRTTNRNRFGANSEPIRAIDKKERYKERGEPVDNFQKPQTSRYEGGPCSHTMPDGNLCGRRHNAVLVCNQWYCLDHHPIFSKMGARQ